MFIFINAFKSITRSKGRNILIGIIVLAIAASSCVALTIRNAADEAQSASRDSLTINASLSLDRQKLMESVPQGGDMNAIRELMSKYEELGLSELLSYAESDFVKDFYYSKSVSLNGDGEIEACGSDEVPEDGNVGFFSGNTGGGQVSGGQRPGGGGQVFMARGISIGDFSITGYSSENAMTKFINGTASITDGEMFDFDSADMKCLISSELAIFNDLKVGDVITLLNPSEEVEDEAYEFTIAGIYTDTSSSDSGGFPMISTSMDPANLICVGYKTFQEIVDHSESNAVVYENDWGLEQSTALDGILSSSYVFANPDDFAAFDEEIHALGLSDFYALSSLDLNNYESSLIPLKNLSDYAATLLLIILAIGAVILIVINVFNIRERKYEVGVLTAIGVKKSKVALQFVTELLCVTLIAIIAGTGVGAVASVPVADSLLSSQIEQAQAAAEEQEQNFGRSPAGGGAVRVAGGQQVRGGAPVMISGNGGMMNVFGGGDSQEVTYLDKINAAVNLRVIAELIGIGLILTIISSLAAVVFVMRYEPLKILAERA